MVQTSRHSQNFKSIKTKSPLLGKKSSENRTKKKKKLNVQYIQKIYTLAKDKTTSEMGSKRIAAIINKDLENEVVDSQKKKKIHFSSICHI